MLTKITIPQRFDIICSREGDSTIDDITTNVPWSVISHSPDGFNWGYGGSGPSDFALNILNAFIPPGSDGLEPIKCYEGKCSNAAFRLYQDFKQTFIEPLPIEGGIIYADDIERWLQNNSINIHELSTDN